LSWQKPGGRPLCVCQTRAFWPRVMLCPVVWRPPGGAWIGACCVLRVACWAVILAAVVALVWATRAEADGVCLTREQAITLIAHKVDVEHGGRLDKSLIWAIADRESGLLNCDPRGNVKVSPTNDHGLLQLNPGGVFANCTVNPYCRRLDLIGDPYLQVDVMLTYADVYGDLCPWNPAGDYLPGCGYGTTVRSGAARRVPTSSVTDGEGQGEGLQMGDGPSRAHSGDTPRPEEGATRRGGDQ